MKGLSVKQPWAHLLAAGIKTIETRKWSTRHRGQIVVCAGRALDRVGAQALSFAPDLVRHEASRWVPSDCGHAIATGLLIDCRPMMPQDVLAACTEWTPWLFAWVLADVQRIAPVPVRGQLGLFEVDL